MGTPPESAAGTTDAGVWGEIGLLREAGRLDEAEIAYRRSLRADSAPETWLDFGNLVRERGRPAEAEAILRRVIARAPQLAAAHRNLGNVLVDLRRFDAAIASLQEAVRLDPADAAAWTDLGRVYQITDRRAEARAALSRALQFRPDDARLLNDLAAATFGLGDLVGAADLFRRALAIEPNMLAALKNFAGVLRWTAEFEEARATYRHILSLEPESPEALNGLAVTSGAVGDFDTRDQARTQLAALLPRIVPQIAKSDLLVAIAYTDTTLAWPDAVRSVVTRRLAEIVGGMASRIGLPPAPAVAKATPRLRIGYISPNFGDHPVGHVTASLFTAHDRAGFEVHGIALADRSAEMEDFARRIAGSFDQVHDLNALAPPVAASRIAALGLDILIDINGYLARSAVQITAFRPAPVQVFWLGHAGGLGLPWIDYVIADRVVVPQGEESRYSERVVRLPECYHCADRHPVAAETPPRVEFGLPADAFVFCAFNHPAKIERAAFTAWMAILARVPGSVLWLSNPDRGPGLVTNLRQRAAAAGIDPARLVFAARVPDKAAHLARHVHAGLFLDTFVHNASTTALDALWAGVPVLTVAGDRWASRIAASMLNAAGLAEMVAPTPAAYVERAVALARDAEARARLAMRLAETRLTCRLFDTTRFVRHLESAYRRMAERQASGGLPEPFDLPALD